MRRFLQAYERRTEDDPREGMGAATWIVALWVVALYALAWVLA